jgi:predicted Ser/Thr protein kinase
MDLEALLNELTKQSRSSFQENQRLISFGEYLAELAAHPRRHTRSAPMYLVDMIEHFGATRVPHLAGELPHHAVFDAGTGTGAFPVIGHEPATDQIIGILRGFAATGHADKLILLHGPNGSAKSSIVAALLRGLEAYSACCEGSLYRFNWVFPTHDESGGSVGFGADDASGPGVDSLGQETYAYLPPEQQASRLPCDLKDHPYVVLPRHQRTVFLEQVATQHEGSPETVRQLQATRLVDACLCARCKLIFDALMASYQGDLARVLRHVQVERFYISRRYRCGAMVIEPQVQMVDSWSRQITMDQSIQNLPPQLQNLQLHEAGGDVIDANRGLLEYSDLLKRPREAFKYLLVTSELGTLNLPNLIAHLDLVLLATVNELHLDEFKNIERNPDYVSFKARMEFVPIPYLLRVSDEKRIYETQVQSVIGDVHIAPHTIEMLSLWAVLTRLRRPTKAHYPKAQQSIVEKLRPLDKALLYDGAPLPERFSPEEDRALRGLLRQMAREYVDGDDYEGRFGASPREIKTVLYEASLRTDHPCVTPLDVFEELEELCGRKSTHLFLRIKPEENGFRDATGLIDIVRQEYESRIRDQVREAMGLVPLDEYRRIFRDYVEHLVAWTTGKLVVNRVTGASEPPDEQLMKTQERLFGVTGDPAKFRKDLVAQIGAYSLEHPSTDIDYERLFPRLLRALRQDVYQRKVKTVRRVQQGILLYGHDDFVQIPAKDQQRIEQTIETLRSQHGYCEHCARDATSYLLKRELEEDRAAGS